MSNILKIIQDNSISNNLEDREISFASKVKLLTNTKIIYFSFIHDRGFCNAVGFLN